MFEVVARDRVIRWFDSQELRWFESQKLCVSSSDHERRRRETSRKFLSTRLFTGNWQRLHSRRAWVSSSSIEFEQIFIGAEIGVGIVKLSELSAGLFVENIELSLWLFVGDIFAYLSGTLAKNVGAFVPSTEVADPRAANRETGYKVCFWFHTKELRLRREEKACFLGKTGNMGCYRTRIRSCLTYQLSKAFQKLLILLLTLKLDVQESVGDSFVTNRSLVASLKQHLNSFRTDSLVYSLLWLCRQ